MKPFSRAFAQMAPSLREDEQELIAQQPLAGVVREIPVRRGVSVSVHKAKRDFAPVLFELHGGGFVLGSEKKNDALAQDICERMDINVISIGYSKAPEHPYPAAVEDVYEVIKWFYDNCEREDINKNAFAVMGFSAGANLATVISMLAKQRGGFALAAQVLHYPYLDAVTPPDEKPHFKSDIPIEVIEAFVDLYCTEQERALPYVSPIFASKEQLAGIAPALIVTAQQDALKGEGERYAKMQGEAGADVRYECIANTHHGYIEDWYNPGVYNATPEDRKNLHHAQFGKAAQRAVELTLEFLAVRLNRANI